MAHIQKWQSSIQHMKIQTIQHRIATALCRQNTDFLITSVQGRLLPRLIAVATGATARRHGYSSRHYDTTLWQMSRRHPRRQCSKFTMTQEGVTAAGHVTG